VAAAASGIGGLPAFDICRRNSKVQRRVTILRGGIDTAVQIKAPAAQIDTAVLNGRIFGSRTVEIEAAAANRVP